MRALLLFFLIACSSSLMGQTLNETININGTQRQYLLRVPAGYVPGTPIPIVFVFHGLGDTGSGIMNGTRFNNISDTANFFVVYPTGLPDAILGGASWNNGLNPFNSANDLGFVNSMIDTISANYTVDSTRIYATGFSMGGFFSHLQACQLNERFAAIAGVSGTLAASTLSNCDPRQAIPVLHFHGTADATIAYDGSTTFTSSVNATLEHWATFNQCITGPDTTDLPDIANDNYTVQRVDWTNCADSTKVSLFIEHNAPHTWLQSNNDIYATEEIWHFFRQYLKKEFVDTVSSGIQHPGQVMVRTISPNPFRDQLNIELAGGVESSFEVMDIMGKVVYRSEEVNAWSFSIETKNWNAGTYFLRTISESGEPQLIKVLKTE